MFISIFEGDAKILFTQLCLIYTDLLTTKIDHFTIGNRDRWSYYWVYLMRRCWKQITLKLHSNPNELICLFSNSNSIFSILIHFCALFLFASFDLYILASLSFSLTLSLFIPSSLLFLLSHSLSLSILSSKLKFIAWVCN